MNPAGGLAPNQVDVNDAAVAALPSMKITDWPGWMVVTPLSATARADELELSSIFQPVMFTAEESLLVSSNQSAA